ncbi:uncharacterized protein LOC144131398 isoform X1 [Amblyomma americanum]
MAGRLSRDVVVSREQNPLITTPFKDYEALKEFDVTLHGSKREDFIQELSGKGGANVTSSTRRLLRHLLEDSLACQFSWLGKKGKHAFNDLRLCSCLISAIKRGHDANDYVVGAAIHEWLRHAPARHCSATGKNNAVG